MLVHPFWLVVIVPSARLPLPRLCVIRFACTTHSWVSHFAVDRAGIDLHSRVDAYDSAIEVHRYKAREYPDPFPSAFEALNENTPN